MKRLRISFDANPYHAPEPSVLHRGPKHARYMQSFKLLVRRYNFRKRLTMLLIVGFIFVTAVLSQTRLAQYVGVWGIVLLIACWIIVMGIAIFGFNLTCPACRKRLMPANGLYCPQCGSDQFNRRSHMRGMSHSRIAFCPECDGTIYDGDNEQPRTYLIRGCTHCGVQLDEKGF